MKGFKRLFVGDAHVLGAAYVFEESMLWPHAGVVQAGRDAVRLGSINWSP
jgi:hypothetical protein